MQSEEKIRIQKNKIIIENPFHKFKYFILQSHPQRFSCINHNQYQHQFVSNQTQINDQYVAVVKILNPKDFHLIEGVISTQLGSINSSQPSNIIYATKFIALQDCCQPQLQELNPQDIELIIQRIKPYGQIKALVPEGNTLLIKYQATKNITTHFIIPGNVDLFGLKLPYFTLSNRLPLGHIHKKLLTLPIQTQILQLKIHNNWLILRNKENLIFLKPKEPLQNIRIFKLQKSHQILALMNQIVAIPTYKYLNLYKFKQDTVIFLAKLKLKGLQAYCFTKYGNSYLFAGINHQKKLISSLFSTSQRNIHLYKKFNQLDFEKHSRLIADKIIHVCQAKNEEPITMIHFIQKLELIVCYCQKIVYVVNMNQNILGKVSVDRTLTNILYMPYQFNISNYIGVMQETFLKIGVDVYDKIGMQIQQYKSLGKIKFITLTPDLYISDGQSINKCSLILQNKQPSLIKTKIPITFMGGQGKVLIYCITHTNIYDFHCILLS